MNDDLKYCEAAGRLWSLATFLRKDLLTAIKMLEEAGITNDYRLDRFNISLDHTAFLDSKTFGEEFLGDTPQQDRTLASGKVKTATGYVVEPTTEDISEYAGDLPRNF